MTARRILGSMLALWLAACGGSAARVETATPSSASSEGTEESATVAPAADEAPPPSGGDALARYAGAVMERIREHWTVPASIPPGVATSLEARVEITVDGSQFPSAYRILEGSGNAEFDASIDRALTELVGAAIALPEPPAGLDDRGHARLRLRGRPATGD